MMYKKTQIIAVMATEHQIKISLSKIPIQEVISTDEAFINTSSFMKELVLDVDVSIRKQQAFPCLLGDRIFILYFFEPE